MTVENKFFIGVDIGQRQDHSAIGVLERRIERCYGQDWIRVSRVEDSVNVRYWLRHVERIPLGTPYEKVIRRVSHVADECAATSSCDVIADATGVGAAVVERLSIVARNVFPVVITSGNLSHKEGNLWMVPRKDLVGALSVMLERKFLKIALDLPLKAEFERELLELRNGGGGSGRDDMAMAVALACWKAKWRTVGPQGRSLGIE